jgi:hypothetical protein
MLNFYNRLATEGAEEIIWARGGGSGMGLQKTANPHSTCRTKQ